MENKPFPINALNLTELKPDLLVKEFNIQFFAGAQNKVKFGLKNVHYSVITDSGTAITYATPVRIPGAVNISLSPNGELTEFNADDIVYWSAEVNNGYDGELEIADLPESFAVDVLGEELDSVDGVLYESAKTKGKKFAILFEVDGDVKARRFVFYYCTATRPNVAGATKEGSTTTPQTSSLTFQSRPHPYNQYIKANTTTSATTVFDGWFADVHEKVTTP